MNVLVKKVSTNDRQNTIRYIAFVSTNRHLSGQSDHLGSYPAEVSYGEYGDTRSVTNVRSRGNLLCYCLYFLVSNYSRKTSNHVPGICVFLSFSYYKIILQKKSGQNLL